MYFIPGAEGRLQEAGLRGFSQVPAPNEMQKSLDAILKALELNPAGGYVKGTAARRQLEQAFASVPECSALQLGLRLTGTDGPLEKLFRYRLAAPTRIEMLQILVNKAQACQQKKKDELRRRQIQADKDAEEVRRLTQVLCATSKEIDAAAQEICRRAGEGSATCLTVRAQALAGREQNRAAGIRCP